MPKDPYFTSKEFDEAEWFTDLRPLLRGLPERLAKFVFLRYEGYDAEQIEEELGVSAAELQKEMMAHLTALSPVWEDDLDNDPASGSRHFVTWRNVYLIFRGSHDADETK